MVKRWVFLSSDAIALPVLEWLWQNQRESLAAVVSQPDRPTGRGRQLRPNPAAEWARHHGVPLHQPEKPQPEWFAAQAAEGVSIGLVFAYGCILNSAVLAALPGGFVNLHASLLPRLRGASPVETALAEGHEQTGVTLMRLVRQMDAGAVGAQRRLAILSQETGADLRKRVAAEAALLLAENWHHLNAGNVPWQPQVEEEVTYCGKLNKMDGWLDFSQAAKTIVNRVHAFDPWPGCFFEVAGERIKVRGPVIWRAGDNNLPGLVTDGPAGHLWVGCRDGVVGFPLLQRPGGKWLAAADFLRGFALPPGCLVQSGVLRPLEWR